MNIKLTCIIGILNLFLFSPANSFAQNKVIHLNDLIQSPDNYSETFTLNESEEINSLVYDIHPTVFISDAEIKTFGQEAPVKAEFHAANYTLLQTTNQNYNAVKLLTIKINKAADLNATIDAATLTAFRSLKYILIECSFDCNSTAIQNLFSNLEDILVFYIIATPE
ncbi:hypothetical protein GCM10007103_33680 [Salinimicrobium marinum]|uniref:Uncharacterized protein n=1 Tax=Salinimicrobium marinum TaxID=680283 RepID=A0A918SK73_9FLAO|nr:hypothetical protein [Salinimicrobium marinum]GHA50130.1 hypothetical protein GCM10007103_33680 [Salinimicrobium marinum]